MNSLDLLSRVFQHSKKDLLYKIEGRLVEKMEANQAGSKIGILEMTEEKRTSQKEGKLEANSVGHGHRNIITSQKARCTVISLIKKLLYSMYCFHPFYVIIVESYH